MADKTHRLRYDISATDNATRVFKQVKGGVDELKESYVGLAGAATAAFAAGGMAAFLSDAVKYRASLEELANTTGDNVRTLDGLARQARISGVEFDRLETSLTRFARNLNAADDEGQAAAQAIAALGLNVADLRALKPADAMLEIAKALGHFEDGASKVAVAVALMGKEGAKQLPFLKDLAEAGDAQGRITAEQAEEALRLEKAWRALKIAFEDTKESLVTLLIPKFADLIDQMREGIKIAGGFGSALLLFGARMAPIAPGQYGERIGEYQQEIEAQRANQERARRTMEGLRGTGASDAELSGYTAGISEADRQIDTIRKKMEFAKYLQRQDALSGRTGAQYLDARDLQAQQKPTLDFVPKKPGAAGALPSLWTPQDEEMFQARKKAWEESDKINADFAKDDEQRAKDNQTMWTQVFKDIDDEQDREIQRGAEYLKGIEDQSKRSSDAARELGMTFASAFEDAVIGGKKLQDVLNAIGMDVARIILRKGVTEPGAAAITEGIKGYLPFAEGGVMTASGPLPLRTYSGGGVADSPQLAMFGEGATPEAYVPLPDGRRIPVQMSGQGGHTFIIDARGSDRSGLAALSAQIARVDGSIEYRAVNATRRAAARRGRTTSY